MASTSSSCGSPRIIRPVRFWLETAPLCTNRSASTREGKTGPNLSAVSANKTADPFSCRRDERTLERQLRRARRRRERGLKEPAPVGDEILQPPRHRGRLIG